jgi:hypothetical protein
MEITIKLILLSFFLTPFLSKGQNYFLVQRKNNPTHTKMLYFDNVYTIKTKDTTYISKIIRVCDSTLSIVIDVKGKDSEMVVSKSSDPKYDTLYTHWHRDTIQVLYRDIQHLEKDLFKSRKWLEPFGYLAVGGGLALLLAPIVAADKGAKDGIEVLTIAGGILGVAIPIIYIGTRKTKFDMVNKWSFMQK